MQRQKEKVIEIPQKPVAAFFVCFFWDVFYGLFFGSFFGDVFSGLLFVGAFWMLFGWPSEVL